MTALALLRPTLPDPDAAIAAAAPSAEAILIRFEAENGSAIRGIVIGLMVVSPVWAALLAGIVKGWL